MKKTILVLIYIFLIMMFITACNNSDKKENIIPKKKEIKEEEITSEEKEAPEEVESILRQLENQDFSIHGSTISNLDEETIVDFGKAFVNLFNGAVKDQENVSFESYISNNNLLKFTDKMLDLTIEQDLQGRNDVSYGLSNEFQQVKLQDIGDNLTYLELEFQFEGSVMSCKMLITSEDKSLKLLDFYFGSKDGVDTFSTGHLAEREINDPNLWEDEGWVKDVFNKLSDYEKNLNIELNMEETTYEIVNNLDGVTMTVKETSVSPIGLTVVIENNSDSQCIFGEYFVLEKKIDDGWYQVPVEIEGNYGFEDIGYELNSGDKREWETDWEWLYGSLDAGQYRIVKDILDFRDTGDFDKYFLAAEFRIA